MKEMKFSSQICTTKEQSKHLLELGLNPETADMAYMSFGVGELMIRPYDWQPYAEVDMDNLIPAWSLHRLMEITDFTNHTFLDLSIAYDILIERIVAQVRFNMQNKEYFNGK